jgi:hypothetical protein
VEFVLAKGFDERLLGPVDGNVLELEMLLLPGPASNAQGNQEKDDSFHSGRVIGYCVTKISKKLVNKVDIF